jgi:manganese transport protein
LGYLQEGSGTVESGGAAHCWRNPRSALLTRGLAIVPAVAITIVFGDAGVGRLLVLSQVILGLQLPFAVVPLLWFTTRSKHLGVHAFKTSTAVILWSVAVALIAINGWGIYELVER